MEAYRVIKIARANGSRFVAVTKTDGLSEIGKTIATVDVLQTTVGSVIIAPNPVGSDSSATAWNTVAEDVRRALLKRAHEESWRISLDDDED